VFNKKILITGADGFIGSHLTETLVKMGYNVRAFVFYNSFNSWGWLDHSPKEIRKSFEVFAGDIRDPHGVRKAMQGCDVVFHLAGLVSFWLRDKEKFTSPDSPGGKRAKDGIPAALQIITLFKLSKNPLFSFNLKVLKSNILPWK